MIVESVVREHVETASFQWAQWKTLLDADPVDASAADWVAHRLDCNLDGIRVAGRHAWPPAIDAFETYPERGELFVCGFLALELEDDLLVEHAVGLAASAEDGPAGLDGAFQWQPQDKTWPYVREWVVSDQPIKAGAAVAALTTYNYDPGEILSDLLTHPGSDVRASACHLAVACRRHDAADQLIALLQDEQARVRVSAAQALSAFGLKNGTEVLKSTVLAMDDNWTKALRSLIKSVGRSDLGEWLNELYRAPDTQKITVRAAGMLGEASYADWLIENMKIPNLADVASKSFLELHPEARDEDLFSIEPKDFDVSFAELLEDADDGLPVASRFQTWMVNRDA